MISEGGVPYAYLCCFLQPVSRLSDTDVEHELRHADLPHLVLALLVVLQAAMALSGTVLRKVWVESHDVQPSGPSHLCG